MQREGQRLGGNPPTIEKSRRSRRLIAESSDEHDGGSQQNTSMASGSNGNIAASELAPSTTPPTFGTFSNPRRTTCYLGSLLQALRSSASTHRVVASHTCTAECPAVCPLRLIQNSWEATESEGSVADLEMWGPWFVQKGVGFEEPKRPSDSDNDASTRRGDILVDSKRPPERPVADLRLRR